MKKYYTLNNIKKRNARYNVIFGERSNGKTFACLEEIVKNYFKYNKQGAVLRRWNDDFKGKRGREYFKNIESTGLIEKYSNGRYNQVVYWSGAWYMAFYDAENDNTERAEKPFCYGFALNAMEHDKSGAYPEVTTILFDEFIARDIYLTDEFTIFMNVLSTIIRDRNDVIIYMCGNTVNKYNPYFREMGLKHCTKMEKGDIDVYDFGESGLRVAVEYSDSPCKRKESDVYFAFDNPRLNMITRGEWELDIYPHCPCKYSRNDILFTCFIEFEDNLLQLEIVNKDGVFGFIHEKTTPIQNPDTDIIYRKEVSNRWNIRPHISRDREEISRRIYNLFLSDKMFYQDNEVGNIIHNYLNS